ncbi:hypothetical protein SAMN04487947_0414 [Halogeometricum rufum]|uniref:Uncharacterized protein n=1 Tax=Halogeometricum rufum TaxID=553469 RepID=A0A1I6G1L3_9EURY|nr:hypothetical protein [Halogeometricum rufum]SFR36068.1 hypothetical protein SAMN04487947_0414 [Halogeometricum rufum]
MQLPIDDRILEVLHSSELVLSPTIIAENIDKSRAEVSRRLPILVENDLVKKQIEGVIKLLKREVCISLGSIILQKRTKKSNSIMIVEGISTQQYKSFDKFDANIGDLNIVVGRNNSGKSGIIDVFSNYREVILENFNLQSVTSLISGKSSKGQLSIKINYKLTSVEYEALFDYMAEKKGTTKSDVDQLRENNSFRHLTHTIVLEDGKLSTSLLAGEINGEFEKITYTDSNGRRKYLKFESLPMARYSSSTTSMYNISSPFERMLNRL